MDQDYNRLRQSILTTIIECIEENDGVRPTLDEIAKRQGVSIYMVREHLNALQEAGCIFRPVNKKRALKILNPVYSK